MSSRLTRPNTSSIHLTDWQLFTNNGSFNNPLPPSRRLKKRNPYFVQNVDAESVLSRSRTARSRSKKISLFISIIFEISFNLDQSAISTNRNRILSARSINYRRTPRVKPNNNQVNVENDGITVINGK
jgi:hypothetical protein